MKKIVFGCIIAATAFLNTSNAQIQKGNWMVGAQVADVKFTNGFILSLTPQLGYFIQDNWAVGGEIGLNIADQTNGGTTTDIGVGAYTRYYLNPGEQGINSLQNHGRFFGQANVGYKGINQSAGATTNGLGLGVGAGYSYFITRNVGLEGIVKFEGVVGGGNQNFNGNLKLGIGFQIFLPTSKAKEAVDDFKK